MNLYLVTLPTGEVSEIEANTPAQAIKKFCNELQYKVDDIEATDDPTKFNAGICSMWVKIPQTPTEVVESFNKGAKLLGHCRV